MIEPAFLSLGSNVEPQDYLPRAVARLKDVGRVLAVSTAYRNPAVGPLPQPDYVNAAVLVETDLPAQILHERLHAIEGTLGRRRSQDRYAPRRIDIDLILLGTQVFDDGSLQLPSPMLLKWAFVAVPLAELAPSFRHPITGEKLSVIAERLRPEACLTPLADLTASMRRALPVGEG